MNPTSTPALPPPVASGPGTDATTTASDRRRRPLIRVHRSPLRRPAPALLVVAAIWMLVMPGAPVRSLGGAIALTSVVSTSVIVARRDRRAVVLVLAAAAMLPWLAIRHSPWLHAPNLVMSCVLFLSAGALQPGESLAVTLRSWVRRWMFAASTTIRGPQLVGQGIVGGISDVDVQRRRMQRRRIQRHGVGLMTAIGLSSLVVALLASGDALFASYLDIGWLLPDVVLRSSFGLIGVALLLAGVGVQRTVAVSTAPSRPPRPEAVTMTVIALTLTIGAYGVVQLLGALRGADHVAARTGLTYADYARGGFFQTVAVVAITVATLAVARSAARERPPRRALRGSSVLLTIGTLCLVASSIVKLVIYTDRFGLTMLRLYTMIFAVWLGGVAVLTCVALIRGGGRWLASVLVASVAIGVIGMNGVDPEALVARHNIDRARQGGDLDVGYLTTLSLDARPAILSGLAELGLPTEVRGTSSRNSVDFCSPIDTPSSGFAVNAEVHAAKRAQEQHC